MTRKSKRAPRYAKVQIQETLALQIADLTQAADMAGNAIVSITEGFPSAAQAAAFGAAHRLCGVLKKRDVRYSAKLSTLMVEQFPNRDWANLVRWTHEMLDELDQRAPAYLRGKPLAVLLVDAMGMTTTAIRALLNGKGGDVEDAIRDALEALAIVLSGLSASRSHKLLLLPHYVTIPQNTPSQIAEPM